MNLDLKEKDINTYNSVFEEKYQERTGKSQLATDNFYTLITKFYEKGWGDSFHFARRLKNETFEDSLLRHEMYLAEKLELKPDHKVLDVGCGVMGPARQIAAATGAHITGLTINQYQVDRSRELNETSEISHLLSVQQGDYMKMPFSENSFDRMFAIEALCHAPDLGGVYDQIYSRLKPGGVACFYQWCLNDNYDPDNPEHVKIKEEIEYGNSIIRLKTIREIDAYLEKSPFTVIETVDLVEQQGENSVPWYGTLQAGWSLKQFRQTKASRTFMKYFLRTFEALGIFPKGITKTQQVLLVAADALVKAGKLKIFTPMYFIKVRKDI